MLDAVATIGRRAPVVFPVHPRTRKQLSGTALGARLEGEEGVVLVDPLGYLDFVGLLDGARLVLTDSGGIQEETTVLGVPCLTLRPSTERPVTVTSGTNTRRRHGSGADRLGGARRARRRRPASRGGLSSGTAARASGSPRCSHATSGARASPVGVARAG